MKRDLFNRFLISLILVSLTTLGSAQTEDPFMGDWEGWHQTDGGDKEDVVARVIALGDQSYQIKTYSAFDEDFPPQQIFDAIFSDFRVTFNGNGITGKGVLDQRTFKGTLEGADNGTFEMKRVTRLSPTLGAKPPKGAIVLFDGKDFNQWNQLGGFVGLIDLSALMGGDNAAGYIRTRIRSEKEQPAVLEIGSDDGVKVWLNNSVVHANNASRGVSAGQDKVNVTLKQGVNNLMLKVNNGAGGWGACVRLADGKGKPLAGVFEMIRAVPEGSRLAFAKNNGFLTVWQIAGPFRVDGKDGAALFDIPLDPEKDGSEVEWKRIKLDDAVQGVNWKLIDNVMEVRGGNIQTKRVFKDFTLHLEFRLPFMPKARGQGRANSGVYLQDRYEIQILDSYGLEGLDNECGGIYQIARPRINMCAPPLQWQTYDITFEAARFDTEGRKIRNAVLTLKHNGITIHDNLGIPRTTGGALRADDAEPGGIYLQDHGNPVQFRNIWIVEKIAGK